MPRRPDLERFDRNSHASLYPLTACPRAAALDRATSSGFAGVRRLSAAALAQNPLEKIRRIRPQRFGDRDKLRHVDLALIALNHPNDGMRPLEPGGQITLGETGVLPCRGDHGSQGPGGWASQCLQGVLRLAERTLLGH